MNKRQAKKIRRKEYSSFTGIYNYATWLRADSVSWRAHNRSKHRTSGHRWGRWDPKLPEHPDTIPF